jgi:hypothetical protein
MTFLSLQYSNHYGVTAKLPLVCQCVPTPTVNHVCLELVGQYEHELFLDHEQFMLLLISPMFLV